MWSVNWTILQRNYEINSISRFDFCQNPINKWNYFRADPWLTTLKDKKSKDIPVRIVRIASVHAHNRSIMSMYIRVIGANVIIRINVMISFDVSAHIVTVDDEFLNCFLFL